VDFPHAWVLHPMAAAVGAVLKTLARHLGVSRARIIYALLCLVSSSRHSWPAPPTGA
jgi:hypothetical protein